MAISPGWRHYTPMMPLHCQTVLRWCRAERAIEAMWKGILAEHVGHPKLTTLDVKPLGPSAAREIGTFSLKTRGPRPQEVSGKYVVVWEKVGNDWKLATDIWNEGK